MKVYKFGGASVRDADGVRNLRSIVEATDGPLFVVVSAMGKMTNALEGVVERLLKDDARGVREKTESIREYHAEICRDLFGDDYMPPRAQMFLEELEDLTSAMLERADDYDWWYDRVVSYGELVSTSIVAAAIEGAQWIDARDFMVTDSRHRDANVDLEEAGRLLREETEKDDARVFVTQGFIGADVMGETTTLGREGSDYSAAVVAYVLDAESLTIWKDVPGVMNADPKIFEDAVHVPELTYLDAVELAYSGAQIIHPKTIKPLQNKEIPLYVKPFGSPDSPGSVIKGEMEGRIEVPVLILKRGQVLISIRPQDFSFVLEERLAAIFELMKRHGVRANLIQSSAVNLSMCVDMSRNLNDVVERLRQEGFRVVWNEDMELLTVRGYTPELITQYGSGENVYICQQTRRTMRVVRKSVA